MFELVGFWLCDVLLWYFCITCMLIVLLRLLLSLWFCFIWICRLASLLCCLVLAVVVCVGLFVVSIDFEFGWLCRVLWFMLFWWWVLCMCISSGVLFAVVEVVFDCVVASFCLG